MLFVQNKLGRLEVVIIVAYVFIWKSFLMDTLTPTSYTSKRKIVYESCMRLQAYMLVRKKKKFVVSIEVRGWCFQMLCEIL